MGIQVVWCGSNDNDLRSCRVCACRWITKDTHKFLDKATWLVCGQMEDGKISVRSVLRIGNG
jgi:hypothetical protein